MLFLLLILTAPNGSARAAPKAVADQPMFFASREACYASYMFKRRECDNAFVNAASELRRSFSGPIAKSECKRRFHLCEKSIAGVNEADDGYSPLMLGVEITSSGQGWSALPMLAVEIPQGQLQLQPISHLIDERPEPRRMPEPSPTPKWLASVAAAFGEQLAAIPKAPRSK